MSRNKRAKRFAAVFLCFLALSLLSGCIRLKTEGNAPSSNTSSPREELTLAELRPDFDWGECRKLEGEITVVVFFADDFESGWGGNTQDFLLNEVVPGLRYLEEEAARYDVDLHFGVESYPSFYYDGDVIKNPEEYVTVDLLRQAAASQGYDSDDSFYEALREQSGGKEVICLTVFNKDGIGQALNPSRGSEPDPVEHVLLFTRDFEAGESVPGTQAPIIAHEILHLYGAEDYYTPSSRKSLAYEWYPNDIMLGTGYHLGEKVVGPATAFYVGWSDDAPEVLYHTDWRNEK